MILNSYTIPLGAKTPFTVLHMSDNHLCLADARDDARKIELAENRDRAFGGRNRAITEAQLAYVRKRGLPLIHTGDLIDFVSAANLDYARQCFDGIDVMMAVGNHEFSLYVGEAWEDEAYKAQSLARVADAMPDGCLFGVRVIEGVKFITLDNNYYYVTPPQLERLRGEMADGLPTVLVMHNPIYTPDLYRQVTDANGPDLSPYLMGVPEEKLRHLEKYRYDQQKPDEVTREFMDFVGHCTNLKAILAGHLHRGYVSTPEDGIPQYVADGGGHDVMNEYTFV